MDNHRRIYLLSPKNLSPETIAVTFAKTSRSPKPFDEIAEELTDTKSAQFHEKWVVGYGHASVAEHAVLHLALENVSRLAIETIEGNRLASYTEKSTRYQQWKDDAFYIPEELNNHPLLDDYAAVCRLLFQTYHESISGVKSWLEVNLLQNDGESQAAYERSLQTQSVDICRFLLPAASLANVGVTINARALEYAICKMLSSPLEEVRAIGESLRKVGQIETPTLIKYAKCNDYLVSTPEKIKKITHNLFSDADDSQFKLISWDEKGQEAVLASIFFRFDQSRSYQQCLDSVEQLSNEETAQLVHLLMAERGKFDQPLREFEYAQMTFEVVMDQGAYFEFKRHRMMTQTVQLLSAGLGFAVPRGITESGCEESYLAAMRRVAELYHQLAGWNQDVASYIIPNGFNRRVLFTMNLREAFHFCRLRAAENAHFSIRRIAFQVVEAIHQIYPLLGAYIDVPDGDSSQEITKQFFTSLTTR